MRCVYRNSIRRAKSLKSKTKIASSRCTRVIMIYSFVEYFLYRNRKYRHNQVHPIICSRTYNKIFNWLLSEALSRLIEIFIIVFYWHTFVDSVHTPQAIGRAIFQNTIAIIPLKRMPFISSKWSKKKQINCVLTVDSNQWVDLDQSIDLQEIVLYM